SDYMAAFDGMQKTADHMSLIVMPTEQCNFRCVYCYESFLKPQMTQKMQEGLKKYISTSMERVRALSIEWFGGEPLLGKEVIRNISTHAVALSREQNVSFGSTITTNGYLLTPDTFDEAVSEWNLNRFQITIDGPRDFHDKRRVLESGGPTFDKIMSHLQYIAKSTYPDLMYVVRMNVDAENLKTVAEFARILKDIVGDDRRARFFARPVWGKSECDLLTNFEARSLKKQMFEICEETGLRLFDGDLFLSPGGGMCYAADAHSLVVGPDGTLYKCTSAFELPENRVGQLTEAGTVQLNIENFNLWVKPGTEKYSQCRQCAILPIWNFGHCPKIDIQRIKKNEDMSRPVCPTYKEDIKTYVATASIEEEFANV
ncbi:MAG: radical SAM protein, partial [Bacteroidetes bacterium]|nr:radical SAM protein [Bacteroidota bacterium]